MPSAVFYDTTLRDGTQGEGVYFSVEDKIRIVKKLDRLGIDYIEGGWPGSNPKDQEFYHLLAGLRLDHAKVVAFGSTRRPYNLPETDKTLNDLLATGTGAVAIFGKSWDLHVREVLKITPAENLELIADSLAYLKSHGREIIYDAEHFFDGFKSNPSYALETLKAAVRGGAGSIVLCDTNGGILPLEMLEILKQVQAEITLPLGVHFHNDSGMAEAWKLDFVLFARAKGLSRGRVVLRHVARNALLPLVTMLGLQSAAMLGGSVVIESVFAIPGFGRLAQEAVADRDTPLLLGIILVSAVLVIFINLAVDIAYAFLDPRVGSGEAQA